MKPSKPKTKLVSKLVRNMTAEEYKACYSLHLRGYGRIHKDLTESWRRPAAGSQVVMVKDQEGQVLSWGLIDRTETPRPTVQLYTRGRYRRMGFGRKVINEIKRLMGTDEFTHFRHDDKATGFFDATQCKNPSTQGSWL